MKASLALIVFIVLLVLKLVNVLTWSWVWVFAPLWIPYAFILLLYAGVRILATIDFNKSKKKDKGDGKQLLKG